MGMQNLITSIDPKTGRKTHDLSLIPEKGKLKLVCPGTVGARNWNSTAYDPGSGLLYLPMFETCNDMGLFEDSASTSSYTNYGEFKTIPRPKPGTDGQFGRVAAVDIRTGRRTWTNKYRAEPLNALLATAGGLVFAGTRDRWFRALDAASGEELWRARLDNVPNSFPISYMVKGRQYLAVASGAGSSIDITVKWAAAEIPNVGPGRTLTVFALPEKFEK